MEDSGREKLRGQTSNNAADDAVKNAGNQDANIDFDSAKIGKNKKEEHFKNIEGAEERARAAERAKEEAKRAAEKAQERADKIQAKIDETPLQKKARLKKTGIIVGIVAALLIVAGIFLMLRIKEDTKSVDQIKEEITAFAQEVNIIAQSGSYESVEEARGMYLKKISSTRGKQKFYYTISYAKFCASHKLGMDECNKYLEEAFLLIEDEQQSLDYEDARCFVYARYGSEKYKLECVNQENANEE